MNAPEGLGIRAAANVNSDPRRVNADLHCHSQMSDGVLTPAEVVRRAHAHGGRVVVGSREHALVDAELLAHHPLGQAGDARQLGRAHAPLWHVGAEAGDADEVAAGSACSAHCFTARPSNSRSKVVSMTSSDGALWSQIAYRSPRK